jgi:hypothetical protein
MFRNADDQPTPWMKHSSGWVRIVPGAPMQPNLRLYVQPDPDHLDLPWTWAVAEPGPEGDRAEHDIGLGRASSAEEAKGAAEALAAAYRRGDLD